MPCTVQLAASSIGGLPGVFEAYHTSIAVDGEELFFSGSGVLLTWDFDSHTSPPTVTTIGTADGWTAVSLRAALEEHFQPGSYDLLRKNCNSFSDVALTVLCGTRLDYSYSRAERWTGWGASPLIKLLGGHYEPNPRADGFDVDEMLPTFQQIVPKRVAVQCGHWVRVEGLESKQGQQMNGQSGQVVRRVEETARFEVRIPQIGVKALREDNLVVTSAPKGHRPPPPPGSHVQIKGLLSEAAKDLNGKIGMVNRINQQTGRCEITLQDGSVKAIQPHNLVPL
jgi:hypothetical protein